nr:aminotransferase class V-fold PLP-dependent enzyme [Streptomyces sp. SolWspMP-sol7th]
MGPWRISHRRTYRPRRIHLNTASHGLLSRSAADAIRAAVERREYGDGADVFPAVAAARAAFARLAGVPVGRVAAGNSVATYAGLVAASVPEGAEVLTAEGDFASVVNPFHVRGGIEVRTVPLDRLAEEVRPGTALVAVSSVQSADGRIADLPAIRAAARAHGARTFVDVSQAAGWLPLDAAEDDFTAAVGFKWLGAAHGVGFLVVPEDLGGLRPLLGGWLSAADPWTSTYGPVREPAPDARRFDTAQPLFSYEGAAEAMGIVERLGVATVHAHDLALAGRFTTGLRALGHEPLPAPGSAIVCVPGLGGRQADLARAGIEVSDRAGNLRASFHLHNSAADVDALLAALG